MAESFGGKMRNIMVTILIGLLVVAFAVWGVNDVFTQRAGDAVISVGKAEVSTDEFEEAFQRELATLNRDQGSSLTNQQAHAQGLHNRVLQRLLTDTVIGIDADELGVGVNRRVARDVVKQVETFQNELTGEFSEDKLNEILAQNRITRAQYENDVFKSLRRQQTVPAIIGGLEAPGAFAEQRYNFITEQRKTQILTLEASAVPAPAEPTDEELMTYIDENGSKYIAPEYRQVVMLRQEVFDFTPDLTVTEDELQAAFQYRIDLGEIGSPETRDVVQITATSEELAIEAAERLARGDDPTELASGLGLVSPQFYEAALKESIFDPETAKTAFELEEGAAKAILGSLGNWYAVGVTKVTAAIVPDFDEQKSDLRDTILKEKAGELLYDVSDQIEDAMADGLTLEEISERLDIPLSYYDYFDRSGKTNDGIVLAGFSAIPGVASDDTLLREIFTSDIGYETDLFETSTEGFAAIRVENVIESTRRPFDEVKETATLAWKAARVSEALDELAGELALKARGGESLADIASSVENGASVEDLIIVRSTPPQNISPQVTLGMLEGDIGAISRGKTADGKSRNIGKLLDIIPNRDGVAGQFLDVLQEQATAAISSDLQNAYQQAILADHPLRENQAKIRQALGIDNNQ